MVVEACLTTPSHHTLSHSRESTPRCRGRRSTPRSSRATHLPLPRRHEMPRRRSMPHKTITPHLNRVVSGARLDVVAIAAPCSCRAILATFHGVAPRLVVMVAEACLASPSYRTNVIARECLAIARLPSQHLRGCRCTPRHHGHALHPRRTIPCHSDRQRMPCNGRLPSQHLYGCRDTIRHHGR